MNKKLFSIVLLTLISFAQIQPMYQSARNGMRWLRSPAGKVFSGTCTAIGFGLSASPFYYNMQNNLKKFDIRLEALPYAPHCTAQAITDLLTQRGIENVRIKYTTEGNMPIFTAQPRKNKYLVLEENDDSLEEIFNKLMTQPETLTKKEHECLGTIAGIIHHEATHLEKNHVHKRISLIYIMPIAIYTASRALSFIKPRRSRISCLLEMPKIPLLITANILAQKKYHRMQEWEADAGIPDNLTGPMAHWLREFAKNNAQPNNKVEQLFAVHPPIIKRAEELERRYQEYQHQKS